VAAHGTALMCAVGRFDCRFVETDIASCGTAGVEQEE